jgi:hypothetical protein
MDAKISSLGDAGLGLAILELMDHYDVDFDDPSLGNDP